MERTTKIAEVEEPLATRMAREVAEEVQLRDVIGQTRAESHLGTTVLSAITRLVIATAIIGLFLYNLYPSEANPILPLLGLVVACEIVRIDGRVNAMSRLLGIQEERLARAQSIEKALGNREEPATDPFKTKG